ncbi:LUD domain-containing protein [Nocardiopsis coralliicola]
MNRPFSGVLRALGGARARRTPHGPPRFADTARSALADTDARRSRSAAAQSRRDSAARGRAAEPDWDGLRRRATAVRRAALADLERHLLAFEKNAAAAGATVHWARDADEAGRTVARLLAATGTGRGAPPAAAVARASSATLGELGIAAALHGAGVPTCPTSVGDLVAEASDTASTARGHGRARARAALAARLPGAPAGLPAEPAALVGAARDYLREALLEAEAALTGANALVADSGSVAVLESEGNVRLGAALPRTLVTVAGIDKVVASWSDLAVLARAWARSATGAPMPPALSTWTGVAAGDGPDAVHVVLVDGGRTRALADRTGRQALQCIQCSACKDVCPVYEKVGDGPYGSVHSGPIGAALVPQLRGTRAAREASLPFASTLCGACTQVCPVGVDIPSVLLELRAQVVDERRADPVPPPERVAAQSAEWVLSDARRYRRALGTVRRWAVLGARDGRIRRLPGLLGRWTDARDLPEPPRRSFRDWWSGGGA